jgi:hypothetical protein
MIEEEGVLMQSNYDYYVNDSNSKTTHIKFHYAGDRAITEYNIFYKGEYKYQCNIF